MPVKKRQTLKNYFLKGALPSEGDFGNLIDSVPNIVDDGIFKSILPAGARADVRIRALDHKDTSFVLDVPSDAEHTHVVKL